MPINLSDRVQLKKTPLFADFDAAEVAILEEYSTVHAYDAGQVIIWSGSDNRALHVLLSGGAVVTIQVRGEVESVLAHLEPGAHFGELTMLDGQPASGTVTAEVASRVLTIPVSRMQDLLDERSPLFGKLSWALLKDLAAKLRSTNAKVLDAVVWGLDASQIDPKR